MRADILESLTCIESNHLVSVPVYRQVTYDDGDSLVRKLPDRVDLFVVELSSSIEHIFSESSYGSASNFFTLFLHCFYELGANLTFG